MKRKCFLVYKDPSQKEEILKNWEMLTKAFTPILLHEGDMIASLDDLARQVNAPLEQPSKESPFLVDYALPVWNHKARRSIVSQLKATVYTTLSVELSAKEMEALSDALAPEERCYLVRPVYERIPLMQTKNCVKKTRGLCDHKEGVLALYDRKGVSFPVYTDCRTCINTIYNSVVLSLHGLFSTTKFCEEKMPIRIRFTIEAQKEVSPILQYFTDLEMGYNPDAIFPSFTTAHQKHRVL